MDYTFASHHDQVAALRQQVAALSQQISHERLQAALAHSEDAKHLAHLRTEQNAALQSLLDAAAAGGAASSPAYNDDMSAIPTPPQQSAIDTSGILSGVNAVMALRTEALDAARRDVAVLAAALRRHAVDLHARRDSRVVERSGVPGGGISAFDNMGIVGAQLGPEAALASMRSTRQAPSQALDVLRAAVLQACPELDSYLFAADVAEGL
jgi:hypothetical protein